MPLNELTGNHPAPLSVPQGVPEQAAPEKTTIQSLEAYRERIKARERPDKSKLAPFYHETLELTLYVGKMSSQGYIAVENVAQYIPAGTQWAGQKMSSNADDDKNRDLAYLTHAVYFEGAQGLVRQTREDAVALLEMPDAGAANRALLHAIKTLNPPREELTQQMAGMMAMTSFTGVMMNVMFAVGWGDAVVNYLAPSATPEEKEWATHQLQKVEEILLELNEMVGTGETMKALGFTPKPIAPAQEA